MTFSLSVYDPRTGSLGSVICSSSPAVAARCQWIRAGIGVVCSQNITNPVLAAVALQALAAGSAASEALASALASDRFADYRQVVVVSPSSRPAVSSGRHALGIHAESVGEHEAAAGNLLAAADVVYRMHSAYLTSDATTIEGRLLDGLEHAVLAGAETSPVRSAGLVVTEDLGWPSTDLRVDWDADPVARLHELWQIWHPVKADYRLRALAPAAAPPFDECA
jgi:uncharacterized Ntn-hydrolase superfamily protein